MPSINFGGWPTANAEREPEWGRSVFGGTPSAPNSGGGFPSAIHSFNAGYSDPFGDPPPGEGSVVPPGTPGGASSPPPAAPPPYRPPQIGSKDYNDLYADIMAWYQQYLGRQGAHNEIYGHTQNPQGRYAINQAIYGSPEAAAYRARQQAPAAGSGQQQAPAGGFNEAWFRSIVGGRRATATALKEMEADLARYGIRVEGNADGSKWDTIILPNGEAYDVVIGAGSGNPQWGWMRAGGGGGGAAGANTASTYGNSASTELFVNEILARMQQLRQPIQDPWLPLLQALALKRVEGLQGAPFTAGEDAALVARYREPLTQARDAEYQRNRERIGARGMLATSGLLDELDQDTNQNYQRGVAGVSNDLAVRAIDEKNRRNQEALAILSSLVSAAQGQRQERNTQSNELLRVAAMLPDLDERRLRLLLEASGDTSAYSQSMNSLLQLAQLSQQQNQVNTRDAQMNAEAWGEMIARMMQALGN